MATQPCHVPAGPDSWRALGGRAALDLDFANPDRPALVTRVLAACHASAADQEELWCLTVSDRIGALLSVVERTESSATLPARVRCPASGCAALFDAQLPYVAVRRHGRGAETETMVEGAAGKPMRLRRPRGTDQRRWREARWAAPAEALAGILSSLAVDATVALQALPPEVVERIGLALEELDPLVAFCVDCVCPACGTASRIPVDLEALALQRLRAAQRDLLVDVHRLAVAYGWSEDQVLGLPAWRRSAYLQLLGGARA